MTFAAAASANHKRKDGKLVRYQLTANAADILPGDIVVMVAAGTVNALTAAASAATGDMLAGIAYEAASYSGGDRYIRVWEEGIFYFTIAASATIADLGVTVYGETGSTGTPQTVTKSAPTHGVTVGIIKEIVSTTCVGVKIKCDGTAAS